MKLIVITTETFFKSEAEAVNLLFENGLETLHLRKPFASKNETKSLLEQINTDFHAHIVLHSHYELTSSFDLKGIHLSKTRKDESVKMRKGTVSYSCHSFEEVLETRFCDYVFLSPVFDSISKTGYKQGFTFEQLKQAKVIDEHVMALGGITPDNIRVAQTLGFGGVAVLGSLWGNFAESGDVNALLNRFNQLKMNL